VRNGYEFGGQEGTAVLRRQLILLTLLSGTVYLRYASERDDWVMGNLASNASPQFG
jgi:hypothetical protein